MAISITTVALIAAIAVIGVRWKTGLTDAASAGKAEAVAGATSLAAMDSTAAVSHFQAASRAFASAKSDLGPEWFANVPIVGRQYSTARSLAEIGIQGSDAAGVLAAALQKASTTTTTGPASSSRLTTLMGERKSIAGAIASLFAAADRASALSTEGLAPPLAEAVRSVHEALHRAAPALARGRAALPLVTYLLSGDRRILVVSQNGAELRPTGGFAGSFGIVEVGMAGVRLVEYKDVWTLPDRQDGLKPPFGLLIAHDFHFRDANWWIDFPTSARKMLELWDLYGQPPVDGMIAIDMVAVRDLLEALGPITVPEYKTTFTSSNLLERLMYLIQVQRGAEQNRKDVLVAMASDLVARVLGADLADLVKVGSSISEAANDKHVQIYLKDESAQGAVDALAWSGRVSAPDGTTDLLAVCSAMVNPGKANYAVSKTITYRVGLNADGSADTTLVLTFANTGPYWNTLPPDFRDWLRVYRAPGVVFPVTLPSGGKPVTIEEFGFPAEVRLFLLRRGQSHTEALAARVPRALESTPASSAAAVGSGRYRLRVIRQADLVDVPSTFTVTPPQEWRVTGASARLVASGEFLPVSLSPDAAQLTVPLRGDLDLDVDVASQ
jgi:hypothetical protein